MIERHDLMHDHICCVVSPAFFSSTGIRHSNGCIRMPLSTAIAKHRTLLQTHLRPNPQGVPAKVDLVDGQNPAQFDEISLQIAMHSNVLSTQVQDFVYQKYFDQCSTRHTVLTSPGLAALRDLPGQGWCSLILEAGTQLQYHVAM